MLKETTYDEHPADREYGPTVLIVDDDVNARDRLKCALTQINNPDEIHILHATNIASALEILAGTLTHVVLLDKNLGPEPVSVDQNGIESIPAMLQLQPHLQILMVTGSNEVRDVVQAMTFGAFGYVTKDMPEKLLIANIDRALQFASLKLDKIRRTRTESSDKVTLAGNSKVFLDVINQSDLLAESDRPVLLLGENGTGKTELAIRIHARRGRFLKQKDRPFFRLNVACLSKDLIESELFGHERGAFTDAKEMKQGFFELANNGTLFLDEIGDLPLELQPKLLTVIEDGIFTRVGGSIQLRSKPKLIFATNKNIKQMVADGTFRKDLYMRISMFELEMPSLDERREDIPAIIKALLPKACIENKVPHINFDELTDDFLEFASNSSTDGNIRGISHKLDRLLVFSPKDKNGRPIVSKWKLAPGLYISKKEVKRLNESDFSEPLTYNEMMTRNWNMIDPNFPGFKIFIEEVKQRLLDEAKLKFSNNVAMAKALKFSKSNITMLFNRESNPKKKSVHVLSTLKSEKEINQ